jgi:CelD/BcsL family acetyltransferase involved in cellulose biosynthesis
MTGSDAVEIVESLDLPSTVLDAWRALAELQENLFVSPEWCAAWATAHSDELPLILLWWHGDVLRGVLPLVRARRGPLRVLRFPGAQRGDWFGPACRPEDERPMASACADALIRLRAEWQVVEFERVDRESTWPAALGSGPSGFPLAVIPTGPSIVLPYAKFGAGGWEEYLSSRSRNFRELRRRQRRLEREHTVTFRLTSSADELAEDMAWLRKLHDARWAGRGGSSWTSAAWEAHGYFARAALERGWLRLWNVEVDGKRAASWYGWRVGCRYCHSLSGLDPAQQRHALGLILLVRTMREGLAEGASVYDMMWGDDSWKRRFETGRREAASYVVGRRGHPARWVFSGAAATMSWARSLPSGVRRPMSRAYHVVARK